jgi:hypothetical protein
MSTRYSLPPSQPRHYETDIARSARGLVALVLVVGLLAIMLWAVVVPPQEPPMAAAPEVDAPAPATASVLPGA